MHKSMWTDTNLSISVINTQGSNIMEDLVQPEAELAFPDKRIWFVPTQIPKPLLESMREYCDNLDHDTAKVFGDTQDGEVTRPSVRKSDVAWIPWDEWIPGIIHNLMISANELHFKYDLRHFNTKIQSTVYGKKGDKYGWHVDGGRTYDVDGVTCERKLSCSLLLSEPDEYEGGELQFSYYSNNFTRAKPPAGTAVIFPAWVPHRVTPIKSGIRRSLVAWMDGPLFK